MTAPISQITIYSNASVLGSSLVTIGTFPVDNNSQRSATLRGENCVKVCFKLGQSVAIPAFSFVEYEGQLFFLKETYRPVPRGNSYYEYNIKFVSFDNMLSKPQAYRKVVVNGETWNEPDIDVVGNLADIATIIKDSIIETAGRYEGVFADMLSKVVLVSDEININSESKAFSFSGQKIAKVLDDIANEYEIDYWFEQVGDMQDGITQVILHFAKCEMSSGELHVSDKTYPSEPFDKKHPTVSGGLDECTFSNEWSGVVQRITPFGSERNIKRGQAIENEMFVSFGKRLRLEYDHSCTIDGTTYQHAYAIKNEDGDLEPLYVDQNGAVSVPGVTTGEESIEKYDDIYPRGHFRVTHVTQRGVDTQIYTVYAIPTMERNGQFVDLTDSEIDAMQADPTKKLYPIDIADGQTLSLHFETGYLNGREFEVANKTAKMTWNGSAYEVDPDNGHWVACFEINPEGDNNDSPQVPYGNLIPRGKFDSTTGYEGDMFAIFNMDMPSFYVEDAQNELAQKAYDEIVSILATRPEVKCKGNEVYFLNHQLFLGQRLFVKSDLFGQDNQGQPLEFVSRVTNYSHPLSKPNNVDFRLCSSRVQGSITAIKGEIADQTNDIVGIDQTARSLSRRAFRDAQEMIGMLQSIVAEMMVVGVERNQFTFTMGIECLQATGTDGITHFDGLKITPGEIQHTQEPYIKDAWEGHYSLLSQTILKTDVNGHYIDKTATETYRNTPYYLYAVIQPSTGLVEMQLIAEKKDGVSDESYLLLGILSSEFLDGNTSLRVFNRSNGYTQITGGTLTTEQLQDPTRQLIIDMSSNPPRIIAKRGAQIIGNITFMSLKDENGRSAIGIQNLLPDKQIYDTADTSITFGSIVGELNGKQFTFYTKLSVLDYTSDDDPWGDIFIRLYVKIKNGSTSFHDYAMTDEEGEKIITFNTSSFVSGQQEIESITVAAVCSQTYGTLIRWKLEDTMIVEGTDLPATWSPCYTHLSDAFEQEAQALDTSVSGGLIISALLQLINQNRQVRAGISGLDGDNILLWGGATYAQALNAALHDYFLNGTSGDLINTLLKMDGTGKIGCFRIVDGNKIAVEAGGNLIIITNETISNVSSLQNSYSDYIGYTNHIEDNSVALYKVVFASKSVTITEGGWHSISVPAIGVGAEIGVRSEPGDPDDGQASARAFASLKVRIKNNNDIIYEGEYEEFEVEDSTDDGRGETHIKYSPTKLLAPVAIKKELDAGSLTVEVFGSYEQEASDSDGYAYSEIFADNVQFSVVGIEKYCVLAKDGIGIIANANSSFYVKNNSLSGVLEIIAKGLPTSEPSEAGQLWVKTITYKNAAGQDESAKVICIK